MMNIFFSKDLLKSKIIQWEPGEKSEQTGYGETELQSSTNQNLRLFEVGSILGINFHKRSNSFNFFGPKHIKIELELENFSRAVKSAFYVSRGFLSEK